MSGGVRTAGIAALAAVISAFLLPGYAWVLISGLSRRMNAAEQATLAFVISIALLSLLTAGLSLVTHQYLLFSFIISLGASLATLAFYALRKRTRLIHFSGNRSLPKALLFCLVIYVIFLVASFWSAPFYPTAEAPDLAVHARVTQAILGGDGRNTLLHGDIPVGLHFAAAVVAYGN